jgi:uncharacterized damage-inducible protein DinB
MAATMEGLSAAFVAEARKEFQYNFKKILHCLDQLKDEDLWWRPHESANSVQNILLHLCGNLRQWIVHGLGGAPDIRNRPQEFADRRAIPRTELIEQFEKTFQEVDAVLAGLRPGRLLEPRRIQGFDETVLSAILGTVTHFVGHTHQIVYISRLRLGDAYRFYWVPQDQQQTSSRQ